MEPELDNLSQKTGISDRTELILLLKYAELINVENLKFNLTGYKTIPDIINNLIIKSLNPLINMNVPRGTLFADLGTGPGIPGIPIAVKYPHSTGYLFDSNRKKVGFIDKITDVLGIENIKGVWIRIEDAGRMVEYREKFDLVFTRAMSDLYTLVELSAPLLKIGGYAYVYSNLTPLDINENVLKHINELGLSIIKKSERRALFTQSPDEGIIMIKKFRTDDKYPRRIAVIKRMAEKNRHA